MGQCSSCLHFSLDQLVVEQVHALNWHKHIVTNFANLPAYLLTIQRFTSLRPPVLWPACSEGTPFTVLHIWEKIRSLMLLAKIGNMSKALSSTKCHSLQIQTWLNWTKSCADWLNNIYCTVAYLWYFWRLSPIATHYDKRSFVCWIRQKHYVGECHKLSNLSWK